MVVYDFDSNMIIDKPIKNRQAATTCDEFLKMHRILKPRGNDLKVYIMYNECSSDLEESTNRNNINFQLAPTNMHGQNSAERDI